MKGRYLFTSESVTEGHPDKVADQISDAVLDSMIAQDPQSRVALEIMLTTGLVTAVGEITTKAYVEISEVARDVIKTIGYDHPEIGFDYRSCAVVTSIHNQSADISQGVTEGEGLHKEQGAGDQGMMFGYASNETGDLMPAPIYYANQITQQMAIVRHEDVLPWMRPDGKSQVTIEYRDGKPARIDTIVVSTQHSPEVKLSAIKEGVIEEVVKKVVPAELLDKKTVYHVNPTGRFVIGGPHGDSGLTGRKIIVDTYGGMARHGGGAFSGKDPSKVDRSAAYYTRYIAKNIVAAGLAEKAEVQVSYAIGVAKPISIMVDTFGTGKLPEEKLVELVWEVFDCRPKAMIEQLDLLRPIYRKLAASGHFGHNARKMVWEKTDKAKALKEAAAKL